MLYGALYLLALYLVHVANGTIPTWLAIVTAFIAYGLALLTAKGIKTRMRRKGPERVVDQVHEHK